MLWVIRIQKSMWREVALRQVWVVDGKHGYCREEARGRIDREDPQRTTVWPCLATSALLDREVLGHRALNPHKPPTPSTTAYARGLFDKCLLNE